MTSWYLLVRGTAGDTAEGPFGLERMLELVADGRVTAETLVARVGAQAWSRAGEDSELAGPIAQARSAGVQPQAVEAPFQPIAPPTEPVVARSLNSTHGRFSLANAMTLGWATMKAHWSQLVLCSLVMFGLFVALQIPGWIVQLLGMELGNNPSGPPAAVGALVAVAVTCFSWVLQIFVGLPVTVGVYYCGVQAVRGNLKVSDCFQGFRRYWGVLGISIVCQLTTTAVLIVAAIPGIVVVVVGIATESVALALAGGGLILLMALVTTALLMTLLYLPPLLVADPIMRAEVLPGSFSIAWQLGRRGVSPALFALVVLIGIVMVLSFVMLIVPGILFGLPLFMACIGAAYELMAAPVLADPTDGRRIRAIA